MTDDSSSLSVNPARQIRRCALLILAAGALLVLDLQLFARAFAQPLIALGSRIEAENGRERLIFDLTGPVKISARPLTDPDRIIVDIADLEFRLDPSAGRNTANSKLIKAFRFGLFAPGRSRIIVDLAQPAAVTATRLIPIKDGSRLIIELAPTDAASFAAAAIAEAARAPDNRPTLSSPPSPPRPSDKAVIVIDPGHGGVDTGALGKHGEQEKAIVFEFARVLQEKIEVEGLFHAVLTREEDIFLPLAERVRRARENNAALFLSIHADTLAAPNVEGATVYTLSARASDAEAARIAEKENLADQAAGLEGKAEAEEVDDILFELTRRETHAYSRDFSKTLISKWKDAGNLNKNPSRSAGFVVLKAHDVPSILLELGYLSSEKDLTRLTSPQWREQAALKLTEAIRVFFQTHPSANSSSAGGRAKEQRPE
ncbi:MAG: N-acetylmuramoyl-L-alanine amidase [Methylocystis sp.]